MDRSTRLCDANHTGSGKRMTPRTTSEIARIPGRDMGKGSGRLPSLFCRPSGRNQTFCRTGSWPRPGGHRRSHRRSAAAGVVAGRGGADRPGVDDASDAKTGGAVLLVGLDAGLRLLGERLGLRGWGRPPATRESRHAPEPSPPGDRQPGRRGDRVRPAAPSPPRGRLGRPGRGTGPVRCGRRTNGLRRSRRRRRRG